MEEEDVGGDSQVEKGVVNILGYSHHAILVVTLLFGLWHLSESNAYPKFWRDWDADYDVSAQHWDEIHEEKNKAWWSEQEKNLTPYWRHKEVGWSLINIAVGVEFLILTLGLQNMFYRKKTKTPSTSSLIVFLSLSSLWLAVPEQFVLLYHQFERRDFPPWGDSLGIPMGGTIFSVTIITPFWLLATYLLIRKSTFPAELIGNRVLGRHLVKDIIVWVGIALTVFGMVDMFGTEYAYLYPSGFLFLYVLLCFRAGNITSLKPTTDDLAPL